MSARDTILLAGQELFATQGIDAVSLREVTRAAGERNVTALQYHFGDRDGLVRAILSRHANVLGEQTNSLLDVVEASGRTDDVVSVIEAVALPRIDMLKTTEGCHYLQIASQVINRSTDRVVEADEPLANIAYDEPGSLRRWAHMMVPLMPPLTTREPLHQRFAVLRFAHIELGRRAQLRGAATSPGDLFAAHLVDLMVAIATAPPSVRTVSILASRAGREDRDRNSSNAIE